MTEMKIELLLDTTTIGVFVGGRKGQLLNTGVEIALGLCGCLAASSKENTVQTEVRMDSTKYQLII